MEDPEPSGPATLGGRGGLRLEGTFAGDPNLWSPSPEKRVLGTRRRGVLSVGGPGVPCEGFVGPCLDPRECGGAGPGGATWGGVTGKGRAGLSAAGVRVVGGKLRQRGWEEVGFLPLGEASRPSHLGTLEATFQGARGSVVRLGVREGPGCIGIGGFGSAAPPNPEMLDSEKEGGRPDQTRV